MAAGGIWVTTAITGGLPGGTGDILLFIMKDRVSEQAAWAGQRLAGAVHGMENETGPTLQVFILLASIFIIALCTIVYELLIGSVSSYFLGDSITQFSLTIGLFMFAMGVGAFISRSIHQNLLVYFVGIEIALGLAGGSSVPLLYLIYGYGKFYQPAMIIIILVIGTLVGLELPLLTRILKDYGSLRVTLANVLSVDYVGALIASIIFPFILLPFLGTIKTSLTTGLINVGVAVLTLKVFSSRIPNHTFRRLIVFFLIAVICLGGALAFSKPLVRQWENSLYTDRIIYSKQTRYQHIVITRWKKDVCLFLNGNLQFSSIDEYRYHESLVHPGMLLSRKKSEEILILGGGDGLAAREVLKYPQVSGIDLVDIDPAITSLAATHPLLVELNKGALKDKRVAIINKDAYTFLEATSRQYSFIIVDLPDPNDLSLSRLYTREFYTLAARHLSKGGIMVVQATSPYFAREVFWCIVKTMQSAGLKTIPYHTYIPSFGDWGFVLAFRENDPRRIDLSRPFKIEVPVKYLTSPIIKSMFEFSPDIQEVKVEINRLDQHKIIQYYLKGWQYWS